MARAVWSGHISFGLIQIPVDLHSAEHRTDIQFHMVDSRNNARVRYERVNAETGEEVPWEKILKAYEYEDGRLVLLNEEDFRQAAPEITKLVEISGFVDAAAIEPLYFDKPYYLVPGKRGEKPYTLLRESLKRSGKAGLARVVIRTREYLALVLPRGHALMLNLLRYDQELRKPDEFSLPTEPLSHYKITRKEIDMAEHLIDTMAEDWKPAAYKDDYRAALLAFIDRKIKKGVTAKAPSEAAEEAPATGGAEVIDLMELLKRSMEKKKAAGRQRNGKHPPKRTGNTRK